MPRVCSLFFEARVRQNILRTFASNILRNALGRNPVFGRLDKNDFARKEGEASPRESKALRLITWRKSLGICCSHFLNWNKALISQRPLLSKWETIAPVSESKEDQGASRPRTPTATVYFMDRSSVTQASSCLEWPLYSVLSIKNVNAGKGNPICK